MNTEKVLPMSVSPKLTALDLAAKFGRLGGYFFFVMEYVTNTTSTINAQSAKVSIVDISITPSFEG